MSAPDLQRPSGQRHAGYADEVVGYHGWCPVRRIAPPPTAKERVMSKLEQPGDAREVERLAALRRYAILDTPAESDFDDIVELSAQLCQTPIALISLVEDDRQWFKARVGVPVCETPRDVSFCAHAMYGDTVMEVPDALADPRFATNPLVVGDPFVRFYAGAPLVSPSGQPLGSLCVVDRVPRTLTDLQRQGLQTLARHVVAQLELRAYAREMHDVAARVRAADRLKEEFIARVNHELRTPLTSINGYLEVLEDPDLPARMSTQFMTKIRRNADRLVSLVDDLLLTAQLNTRALTLQRAVTDLSALASTAAAQAMPLVYAKGLQLRVDTPTTVLAEADARRLSQALDRLLLNAVKFTDRGDITVAARYDGDDAVLEVRDTGIGIGADDRDRVLAPFHRASVAERAEVQGVGLGLSIVKAIIDAHDGEVTIAGAPGRGTVVTLRLPRSM